MNWTLWGRVIAIAVGATLMFGLSLGLGQSPYIAIPAGVFVYLIVRGAFAFMAKGTPPKPD